MNTMSAAVHPLMSGADTMLWSAAAGALGLVVLLALADTFYSRTRAASQTLAYLALCWGVVMLLSGLPAAIWPGGRELLATAQILVGPLCAAMGSFGASKWLSAHQRDHLMKVSLLAMTLVCLAGGPLCLLLAPEWRLPASGALAIANLSVVLWLSVRATQLGDKLAWGLALGCLLTLPAQIGLYGMALNTSRPSLLLQAGVALAALLSVIITAAMLWLRNHQTRQMKQGDVSRRDPITQLYNGVAMVQKIIRAQRRRLRTRRDGALMAVLLFEPERLLPQIGQAGLNDMYIQLARRMQRHTGAVNPAGRYYDRCFVVLLETMHSPRWIRTLGLRVASSLRRPMDVPSLSGRRLRISPDIAVGIVHLSAAGKDVDQLLHEAQSVAEAARGMRSRAALLDPESHSAVPVEHAELGSSWRALRNAVPKAPSRPKNPKTIGSKAPRAGRPRHKPA
jgi:GGDEF domain-containing protein